MGQNVSETDEQDVDIMNSDENDTIPDNNWAGGLASLSGFFFQFLGTLAHIGEFSLKSPTPDVPQMPTETWFSVEVGDSDYQLTHGRKIYIVQFKHSANPENNKIYPDKLYEAMKKLCLEKQRIIRADAHAEVECIFATNRPLADESIEAVRVAKQGKSNTTLAKHRGFKGYAREVKYRLETEDYWIEIVDKLGHQYGMTPDEIQEGIHRVVTNFMKRTLEGRRTFSHDAVNLAFVGFAHPRKVEQMHDRAEQEIEGFFTRLEVPDTTSGRAIATRSTLMRQLQAAIRSHALVILAGHGGNGKSTLLAAALRDQVDSCFVIGSKVSVIRDDWIPRSVSNWRNAPPNFDVTQTLDCALGRLQNWGEQRPILVAALDALDEVELGERGLRVAELIRQFDEIERGPKPPVATLLLTCRSRQELRRLLGEPGHSHFQSANDLNTVTEINVLPFDESEILSALSRTMDQAIRNRLQQEFATSGELDVQTAIPQSHTPIAPDLKKALQHPVIWGLVFDGEFQADKQKAILDGDANALGELADKIADWFGEKCQARTDNRVLSDDAMRTLYLVARHCATKTPPFDFNEDWEGALQKQAHLLSHAMSVVKQAISAGLVEADFSLRGFPWQWRHPFVMRHLVNQYNTSEAS